MKEIFPKLAYKTSEAVGSAPAFLIAHDAREFNIFIR